MNKFIILLACVVSLATAGILDRGRIGIRNDITVGRNDNDRILRMSRDELLRQKFLLDVLQNVHQPLVNDDLLRMSDRLIIDENVCNQQIDGEMQRVIDLARNGRLLSRDEVFTITNEDHLRQMVGIYRLLMCIRDWDTLQRNVCHLRKNINGVLLVNSLLLVVRDRQDTQMLIVPGTQDILPEVFNDETVIRKVSDLDLSHLITDTDTTRPGLMDIVGMGRRTRMMNRLNGGGLVGGGLVGGGLVGGGLIGGGRMGLLDRTQLWMPWRDMHRQMTLQRLGGGQGQTQVVTRGDDRLVVPITDDRLGLGSDGTLRTLLIDDMGMKSFVHGLVNDLILKGADGDMTGTLGVRRTIDGDQMNRVNRWDDMDRLNRMNTMDHSMERNDRVDRLDQDMDMDGHMDHLPVTGINNDRLLRVNRRRLQTDNDMNIDTDTNGRTLINTDGDRFLNVVRGGEIHDGRRVVDTNDLNIDDIRTRNRLGLNNMDIDGRRRLVGKDIDRDDMLMGRRGGMVGRGRDNIDMDLPTTDINDDRLLHVNRRRMHMDTDVNRDRMMDNTNRVGGMMHRGQVHDGRRVVDDNDSLDIDDIRERERLGLNNMDVDGRRRLVGKDIDRDDMWMGRRGGMVGRGRDNLDMDLGTTDVNNGRLLHVNRRRMHMDTDINRDRMMDHTNRVGGMMHRGQVHDGRRVVDDNNDLDLDDIRERERLGLHNLDLDDHRRLVDKDIDRDDMWMGRRGGMVGRGRDNIDMDLGTTDVNNGRLLHVNRRRMDTNVNRMMDNTNRVGGMMHRGQVHDGRRVVDDDNDLDIDRQRLGMNSVMGQRRMTGRDLDTDDIRVGHRGGMINRGRDNIDMDLPTGDINDGRLLHVNRRRLLNVDSRNTVLGNDRTRFMNVVRGGQIHDGRRVGELDIDDILLNRRRGNMGLDNDDNMLGRVNRHRDGDDNDDLPTTNIDDDRLMHVNRRRINKMISRNNNLMGNGGIMDNDDMIDDIRRSDRLGVRRGDRLMHGGRILDGRRVSDDSGVTGRRGGGRLDDTDRWNRGSLDGEMAIDDWDLMQNRRSGRVGLRNDVWGGRQRGLDMHDDDSDMMMHTDRGMRHRMPRSLDRRDVGLDRQRGNEVLLHNLQQLIARINLESIALGIVDTDMDQDLERISQIVHRLGDGDVNERDTVLMNNMRLRDRSDRLHLDRVNDLGLLKPLSDVLHRELSRVSLARGDSRDVSMINNVIGDVLMGRVDSRVGILNILREVLLTEDVRGVPTMGDIGVAMHNGNARRVMRRVLHIVDMLRRDMLGNYKRDDLLLDGVTINNVIVDNLRTHVDVVDRDLTNLVDARLQLNTDRVQKIIIGRQRSINHKRFNIRIDLNSNRNQRVVVRTLLIPMVDASGRQLTVDQQRLNSIVLDAHIVDLKMGHNEINRKSTDIDWTARDTTPYTEIYQRVLMAMNGKMDTTNSIGMGIMDQGIVGQTCRFPHRLLLPRGRADGLRMQMLVIITSVDDMDNTVRDIGNRRDLICGMGIGSLHMDRRSMNFPLDRQMDDLELLRTLSNVRLLDLTITHDDTLGRDRLDNIRL